MRTVEIILCLVSFDDGGFQPVEVRCCCGWGAEEGEEGCEVGEEHCGVGVGCWFIAVESEGLCKAREVGAWIVRKMRFVYTENTNSATTTDTC